MFYIIIDKIKNGIIKVKNVFQQKLKPFFEKAQQFLQRALLKFGQKNGFTCKGSTHMYTKKDGKFKEGSDIIHLDEEMGEYYRTTVTKTVSEEEVPPQYRTIKNEEIIDDTEELDAVLSF